MKSPNILMVMADQLAPQWTGTYGHAQVHTPNMDALAERGARFDTAYVNSPLCAPARFSMLAGQAITKIGAYDNASEFPSQIPTLNHYLRLMGYRTCLSGKMHFVGPDQLHGFNERLTTDIYPADFAWTPDWDSDDRNAKWYHGMDTLHEAGQANTTYQIDYDEEVGFATRRKLFDYARDKSDAPWFLCASFIHPHDPYVARPEWWNLYNNDDIEMPKPVNLAQLDPHSQRIRKGIESDTVGHSDQDVRNARHGYFSNVSYFDHWVGDLVRTLEETGQSDNTVVLVTSDHGDMLGERGAWFKMSFFEQSARVPLIMAGPGVAEGITVGNACGHLDYLPTMLDIAAEDGTAPPTLGSPIDGRSLWELAGGGRDDIDETMGEYTAEMTRQPIFMIRRGEYKYIQCESDPALLFNLAKDPDEQVNLADDAAHAVLSGEFADEVSERWDASAIRDDVIASQHARRTLDAAMRTGDITSWDFHPRRDAANEYVRNHMDWFDAGPRSRFPRME